MGLHFWSIWTTRNNKTIKIEYQNSTFVVHFVSMVLLNLATVTLLQTVSVTVVQSCLMLVSYPVVVQPCGNQRWAEVT